jgi:hypothetical protein
LSQAGNSGFHRAAVDDRFFFGANHPLREHGDNAPHLQALDGEASRRGIGVAAIQIEGIHHAEDDADGGVFFHFDDADKIDVTGGFPDDQGNVVGAEMVGGENVSAGPFGALNVEDERLGSDPEDRRADGIDDSITPDAHIAGNIEDEGNGGEIFLRKIGIEIILDLGIEAHEFCAKLGGHFGADLPADWGGFSVRGFDLGEDRFAVAEGEWSGFPGEPGGDFVEVFGSDHDAGDDGDAGAVGDHADAVLDGATEADGIGAASDASFGKHSDDAAIFCTFDGGPDCDDGDTRAVDGKTIVQVEEPAERFEAIEFDSCHPVNPAGEEDTDEERLDMAEMGAGEDVAAGARGAMGSDDSDAHGDHESKLHPCPKRPIEKRGDAEKRDGFNPRLPGRFHFLAIGREMRCKGRWRH